jgi:hypothetical protein
MIANTTNIHDDLMGVYQEIGKMGDGLLDNILAAIRQAKEERDLQTLEVQQRKPITKKNQEIESDEVSPAFNYADFSVESITPDPKIKAKETEVSVEAQGKEKKILFGMGKDGFVNDLTPDQEKSIARMLMGKPGSEVPGAENLVIRYKGEIIASTNEHGILEANELYGKISPETLQRLTEEVAKTPYANAPERAETPSQDNAGVPSSPTPTQAGNAAVTTPIQTPVEEPKIPRPVKRTPILDGNPVTQVQAALAAVAVTGNGVAAIATEIQATNVATIAAATKVVDPMAIDPKSITNIRAGSEGKAAGIMNWMRENIKDGENTVQSPNGFIGKIEQSESGQENYTLTNPKGTVVFAATVDNKLNPDTGEIARSVDMDTYNTKGIGREWEAIKKTIPTPEQAAQIDSPTVSETSRNLSESELLALKDATDKYVVKPGMSSASAGIESAPGLQLGYEKLPDGNLKYSLYSEQNPAEKVSFTYDEKNGDIKDVQQTTTPSMLSFAEKANAHMREENNKVKDAADKVNFAEDREPGSQAAAPVVPKGQEIPLSSIPTQTSQAPEVTAKLSKQQVAMISKSIAIVDATCLSQDDRVVDLEHTRVSIEDQDKNTKIYTIRDLDTKAETKFSHDKDTGEIVVYKESDTVTKLIDKEEQIFAPVIPGYPELIATTSKQIEKGGELTLTQAKGGLTKSTVAPAKIKVADRGGR